jgi:hypothetical protein
MSMKGDRRKDLEEFHADAKAKGVNVTPALERRYLAWLDKIEAQQARGAAKLAAWHAARPGFDGNVEALIDAVKDRLRTVSTRIARSSEGDEL